MRFDSIEKFPASHYEIDVSLKDIIWHLDNWERKYNLTMEQDYQREHVWTEEQQIAYVEYLLRGGEVGKVIIVNAPGWRANKVKKVEVVDGKQRLTAMKRFMTNEIKAFGSFYKDYEDSLHCMLGFKWRVVSLDRLGVLNLYLSLNGGGTQHTPAELDRVAELRRLELERLAKTQAT